MVERSLYTYLHGKNDFAEGSKILLGTNRINNFVGVLKIMSNAAKKFDILATLNILHNYFDLSSTKLLL